MHVMMAQPSSIPLGGKVMGKAKIGDVKEGLF